MKRYLYMRVQDNIPYDMRFFYDRSAGEKHVAEKFGLRELPQFFWVDDLKRGFMANERGHHWLYEMEII